MIHNQRYVHRIDNSFHKIGMNTNQENANN